MENFEALKLAVDSLVDTIINEEKAFIRKNGVDGKIKKAITELNQDNGLDYTAEDIINISKLENS